MANPASGVLVPLADGFEEIEAVTVIDLLRRADIPVTTAALDALEVTGSHGITMHADRTLDEALASDFEMVVLPGGMPGAANLENDSRVTELLTAMANSERFTAAICAAPRVLARAGLLEGRTATSYPGFLDGETGIRYSEQPVVTDGKILTSRGPGTAMDFALALIETLRGRPARDRIESRLQRPQ